MALLALKSMIPNLDLMPDLSAVPTFTRNMINLSNFLVNINEVNCHMGPLSMPHRKKRQSA